MYSCDWFVLPVIPSQLSFLLYKCVLMLICLFVLVAVILRPSSHSHDCESLGLTDLYWRMWTQTWSKSGGTEVPHTLFEPPMPLEMPQMPIILPQIPLGFWII